MGAPRADMRLAGAGQGRASLAAAGGAGAVAGSLADDRDSVAPPGDASGDASAHALLRLGLAPGGADAALSGQPETELPEGGAICEEREPLPPRVGGGPAVGQPGAGDPGCPQPGASVALRCFVPFAGEPAGRLADGPAGALGLGRPQDGWAAWPRGHALRGRHPGRLRFDGHRGCGRLARPRHGADRDPGPHSARHRGSQRLPPHLARGRDGDLAGGLHRVHAIHPRPQRSDVPFPRAEGEWQLQSDRRDRLRAAEDQHQRRGHGDMAGARGYPQPVARPARFGA
mmetsp:Transcript_51658/g.167793  ORF Transcript_51658/g.167793 Transcript_51658/m.167793 type:complete len:286 (+) Transcript_51658:521-1378(+)